MMKFFNFFDDLLIEARMISDEKFNYFTQNISGWLFDELYMNPERINLLPNIDQFKTYVRSTINKVPTNAELVENLTLLETFLDRLNPKESQQFIKQVLKLFPTIMSKFNRFGKPELSGKRGRPFGLKNKPKPEPKDVYNISITKKPVATNSQKKSGIEQAFEPEIKKRGRPKIYSNEFTANERSRYKREGISMINNLESKVELMNNEVDVMIQRIKKIMKEIDKRKKFFGVE
jgi:hypothetical protein